MAAVSYVSTNCDNLVVLSAYVAKPGYRPLFIKTTFAFVCLTVLLISLALAQAADVLPTEKIRYLGLIPIGLGVYHLSKLTFGRLGGASASLEEPKLSNAFSSYLTFGLVLLANSSDTVSVMTPLLADLRSEFVVICFAAAVATAISMSSLANMVARHPAFRSRFEKVAEWALPFLLIAIGVLIFTDKPADVFIE